MARDLLLKKFEGKPPREAPPPSRWGRGRSGALFTVRKVGFRNKEGKKLYRLGFFETPDGKPLFSSHLWTLDKLNEQQVTWLQVCPVEQEVEVQLAEEKAPAGAEIDTDDDEPVVQATLPSAAPVKDIIAIESDFYVGEKVKHNKSGNTYKVLEIIDGTTVKVAQFLESGAPTPARKMQVTALSKL